MKLFVPPNIEDPILPVWPMNVKCFEQMMEMIVNIELLVKQKYH